jgi:hypothetical protein
MTANRETLPPRPSGTRPIVGREIGSDTLLGYPPQLYPFHTLIVGKSGSGKSALAEQLYSTAQQALSGPTIVIDAKGDGLPERLVRTIAARQGDDALAGVQYFDATTTVPALNPLDIRPALAAGLPRSQAVTACVDQYTELLRQLMDGFDDANRSPTLLRYLLRSLFDPVHGSDVVSHGAFLETVRRARFDGTVPEVSEATLAEHLAELRQLDRDHRETVLGGVATRIEKVTERPALNAMFTSEPGEETSLFRFADRLDTETLCIFDLSGLSDPAIDGLTTVLCRQLWQALQYRNERLPAATTPGNVLLGIEEAASAVAPSLLAKLLAEGRGHGLSVVTSLQYPKQVLDDEETNDRLYGELLNESESILAGQVTGDAGLTDALATPTYPPEAVRRDLGSLDQDRWLFVGPTAFERSTMETEVIAAPPLVCAHPDSPLELDAAATEAVETVRSRTAETVGVAVASATTEHLGEASDDPAPPTGRPQTTLWTTTRLPEPVAYDERHDAIACATCEALYPPRFDGLRDAIECHGSLSAVDPDRIPPVAAAVKLTPDEIADTAVTRAQLVFLQVVVNAMRRQYHPLEYDLVHDSMRQLRAYTGLSTRDVDALIEEGLLVKDDVTKQVYYTVTPDGRALLNEPHRQGIHHGVAAGDLNESTTHIAMVEALRRYLIATYRAADDSPVTRIEPYYQPDGLDDVLDVAGLSASGEVIVAGEAERRNHDPTAARADYSKLAALDLEAAVWVAPGPTQGHEAILDPLTNPAGERDPLIDIDPYSHSTAMRDINITAPGLTDIFTFGSLRTTLADLDLPDEPSLQRP